MKNVVLLIVMVVMVLMALPAMAQTPAPTDKCTADTLTALSGDLDQANKDAQAAITKGDLAGAMDALTRNEAAVQTMRAECDGLSFAGTDATVIGPLVIPEGTYRMTVTTDGFAGIQTTPTKGECGASVGAFTMPVVMAIMEGQANNGSETLLQSTGCTVLIQLSTITKPWTLTLEKVG